VRKVWVESIFISVLFDLVTVLLDGLGESHLTRGLGGVRFRLWTCRRAMTLLTAFVARELKWLTVWMTADVKSSALLTHALLRSWTCSFLPVEAPALFFFYSSMQRFLLHKFECWNSADVLGQVLTLVASPVELTLFTRGSSASVNTMACGAVLFPKPAKPATGLLPSCWFSRISFSSND